MSKRQTLRRCAICNELKPAYRLKRGVGGLVCRSHRNDPLWMDGPIVVVRRAGE